jgi:NhaP-type Na+/H+ or K+/H+ antiporter
MAWEHLDINRPHLVYIILGGFTSLFMLCSSVIKERLYIGEATVATICGIIFGPHAANLINPLDWGNADQITLEFSRVVLVVQCFAVGVELPKSYMERHWKSVTLLLVPVMTFGWLVTSLFIWWMFSSHLNWLDSLCIAACVTATDPVLASSVVGKGKFAKRVPKHLRDLLSAESGCNDGMAFPFIYLAVYLIRYRPDANAVSFHWFLYTIMYECIFGAFYGVAIGYLARRAVRYAHERDLIDRESFLVFYFVLALFCAGSGSILGIDDLLVGFACGVGFSNDGWFQEKTEESHVSNVIDLLINLAFFVYFGTIIPWEQYNAAALGIQPWRLVVVGVMVVFFRRIPIMMALKPIIPDIKTWREALFAGHFGPIGVGAIFVAILARAELETESTTPLAVLPEEGFEHLNIIELIWPITTFLVIVSIVVHGSSIAVFTLGKRINTLTLTLSYTQANEEGPSWMDRLPRIQSRSKTSMSMQRPDDSESAYDEKDYTEGPLSPTGLPGNFLRRQGEENGSRSSSVKPAFRRKKWDAGIGPGGPVSQSAIGPKPRRADFVNDSDTLAVNSDESPDEIPSDRRHRLSEPEEQIYREGSNDIIEDMEGNVLEVRKSPGGETEEERGRNLSRDARRLMKEKDVQHGVAQAEHGDHSDHQDDDQAETSAKLPENTISEELKSADPLQHGNKWRDMRKRMDVLGALGKRDGAGPSKPPPQKKHGPALAYQFGNTIIVEDEDGEVIKKYDIPAAQRPVRPGAGGARRPSFAHPFGRDALHRMSTYVGVGGGQQEGTEAGPSSSSPEQRKLESHETDDDRIRFTINAGGRRMSKAEFIKKIQNLDPKSRDKLVEESDAPEELKRNVREGSFSQHSSDGGPYSGAAVERFATGEERPSGPGGLALVESNREDIPFHPVSDTLAHFNFGQGSRETAAQRRRRLATHSDSEDDSDPRPGRRLNTGPASSSARNDPSPGSRGDTSAPLQRAPTYLEETETAAERRRRLAALGTAGDDSSSSEDEEEGVSGFREPKSARQTQQETATSPSIRFAPQSAPSSGGASAAAGPARAGGSHLSRGPSGLRLRWGADVGQKPSGKPSEEGGNGGNGAGGKKK